MHAITPFLWFDDNAEEAVNFYVSIFERSKITSVTRYGDAGPGPAGQVWSINFQLNGQDFMALNGGPHFQFSPAISFFVPCETQQEVDALWEKLGEGSQEQQCGWIKDKFGVSWQIVPTALGEMLQDPDPRKSQNVVNAMLQMEKLDIEALQRAYEQ